MLTAAAGGLCVVGLCVACLLEGVKEEDLVGGSKDRGPAGAGRGKECVGVECQVRREAGSRSLGRAEASVDKRSMVWQWASNPSRICVSVGCEVDDLSIMVLTVDVGRRAIMISLRIPAGYSDCVRRLYCSSRLSHLA